MTATPRTDVPAGLLERGAPLAAFAERLAAIRAQRAGRLVLVAGEAGIGKTALIRAFCAGAAGVRVLWGACDALHTPRVLGPFADVAEETGGPLGAVLDEGAGAGAVAAALARELRRTPTVLVLEDLHWADEGTLDVLRLLARRLDGLPVLVLATYRDDELHRAHPLRLALGDLGPQAGERLAVAALTPEAVGELAAGTGVDGGELHRRTGGNPFFVSEVLAAGGTEIPDTVRDAVLARAARLAPDARALLDAVAVVPGRAEVWLLDALLGDELTGLDDCLASGMLQTERSAVGFRHEIARVALEDALAPHRRIALHRRALDALTAAPGRRPDLARLAHHAEAADDAEAVLRFAPPAGARAAAFGAHREAASQYARALRFGVGLAPVHRAELLERQSFECYLTNAVDQAIRTRSAAMEEHRALGDRRREGDAHRWLSRLAWYAGDNVTSEAEAQTAIDLLGALAPGPELAMAFSNMAQLRMLASDARGALLWGRRAIDLAERFEQPEILLHALNNVGTAMARSGAPEGAELIERSLAMALERNLEDHVTRAYTNLGVTSVEARALDSAARWLADGIAYCNGRDLDSYWLYVVGYQARLRLDEGRWDDAAADATTVLDDPRVTAPTRITALAVLGALRARRGDPEAWVALDEARAAAESIGELQRVGPVAAVRAEARWLAGEDEAIDAETAAPLALALDRRHPWLVGELLTWRRRAGLCDAVPGAPGDVAGPYALELAGDPASAAAAWKEIGCPYDAALALAQAGGEPAQRAALAELQRLGARPAANRVARGLRERGARDVRRGPRAATRENPGGLTARELEVAALLADGLRNAEIAERLFMSERTVAHHVSAILRKLDVRTRSQAGAAALRLGIAQR